MVSPQNTNNIQTEERGVTSDETRPFCLQLCFDFRELFQDLYKKNTTYAMLQQNCKTIM